MKLVCLSALVVLSVYSEGAPPPADGGTAGEEQKEKDKEYVRKKWGDAALLEALAARHTALDAAYNSDNWANLGQLFTGNARLISYKTNATEGRDNVVGFFKHVKEFVIETATEEKTEEKKEGEDKKETEKKEEKKEEKPKVTPKVTFKYEILFAATLGDNMAWAKGEYN